MFLTFTPYDMYIFISFLPASAFFVGHLDISTPPVEDSREARRNVEKTKKGNKCCKNPEREGIQVAETYTRAHKHVHINMSNS